MIMDFDGREEGMKRAFEKTEEEILEIKWKKKKPHTWKEMYFVCMLSRVWFFATPWPVACQAPLSMEFSSQEYWSRGVYKPNTDFVAS